MTTLLTPSTSYDVAAVRADFPVLGREIGGRPLVYLDNASSSHKPRQVLDAERQFVEQHYSNVHRGVHTLSQEATDAYEAARERVARFLGAPDAREVVFTKNATEAYNLVAYSFGNAPRAAASRSAPATRSASPRWSTTPTWCRGRCSASAPAPTLRWIPLTDDGRLDLTDLESLVNERTKVLAFVHVSNILGTENPVDVLVRRAREVGAFVLIDGAQSARTCRSTSPRSARLLRADRPQDAAPVRHRRAVGPARAARRDAALHGRRLDDRGRPDGRLDLRRAPERFEAGTR
jgi:cysteine desulfurase/selenocysteine lyase